jgi:hypothetical protein
VKDDSNEALVELPHSYVPPNIQEKRRILKNPASSVVGVCVKLPMQPYRLLLSTLIVLSGSALTPLALQAGERIDTKQTQQFDAFERGSREIQLGVAGFMSLNNDDQKRPEIDDLSLLGRYGWMLTSPAGSGAFEGNWEFLLDAGVGGIVEGPGDLLAELALLLRYNFVHSGARCIPYFQIGAGGEYSDLYQAETQRVVGSEFSFNLRAAIGFRHMCSQQSAVYLEAGYRHISNCNTADRNLGLNSLGVQVGYSWFF